MQGLPFDIMDFEHIINTWEKKVHSNSCCAFVFETFSCLLSSPKYIDKGDALKQVYEYWTNQRAKLKCALIRKYWNKSDPLNTDPNVTFRPCY